MKNLLSLTGALAIAVASLVPALATASMPPPGTSVQNSSFLHISRESLPNLLPPRQRYVYVLIRRLGVRTT